MFRHQATERFTDRVADYVRTRPHYPAAAIDQLAAWAGIGRNAIVADIGSGTGISTEALLQFGFTVYAVEPNEAMRQAAEQQLSNVPRFVSVAGTAEATKLASETIDLVVCAQAFHWFDPMKCRSEFARILRPPRRVALMWNTRRTDTTPFLRAYEQLLHDFGTDYREVNHAELDRTIFDKFFGPAGYEYFTAENGQSFDFEGLSGRLRSSSYAPPPGHGNYESMMQRLREIFDCYQDNGQVRFEYVTELFCGHVE